jgi:large subunit ribosomal protein L25
LQGSGASRRLRRANKVPGIIYGGGRPGLDRARSQRLLLALRKEAFHSSVLTIKLDGAVETVLLRDSQMHPYKPLVLHVDFLRVDATHAITRRCRCTSSTPTSHSGRQARGGNVSHAMNEIDVACLPQDLPAFIEVDLKDLKPARRSTFRNSSSRRASSRSCTATTTRLSSPSRSRRLPLPKAKAKPLRLPDTGFVLNDRPPYGFHLRRLFFQSRLN